jgi:alpha-tubulin suppressor-like RCC1 family protein
MRLLSHLPPLLVAVVALGCTTTIEVGRFEAHSDAGSGGAAGDAGIVPLTPQANRLALGAISSCAIDASGGVVCWGDNISGQLGIGSDTPESSSTALPVLGLASGARAVFGGAVAECAVLEDGHATCWGDSVFGQFNEYPGVHAIAYSPFDAPGLSSLVSMGIGTYFHCALNVEGGVKCYGLNGSGQLGSGSLADSYTPASVLGLPPARRLAASQSGFFACAVAQSGALYCWGDNSNGQLGTGSKDDALQAKEVTALGNDVSDVTAGRDHACAIAKGQVWCWGDDSEGQLGDGGGVGQSSPLSVAGMPPVRAVAAGVTHTCALTEEGAVYCWGSSDSGSSPAGPALVIASGVVEIAAGGIHSCALLADGVLSCWGADTRGELGPFAGAGAPL